MSKKQKVLEAELQEETSEKQDQITEGVVAKDDKKADKKDKNAKDSKKKSKKKKEKTGGLVRKTKETASELKKVSWPSFGEVVKKTGVVVAFVILFGLFIYGVNALLGYLSGLLW